MRWWPRSPKQNKLMGKHKRGQTFMFSCQRDREEENQQQREKKMAMLLKIPKVTDLHLVSFFHNSNSNSKSTETREEWQDAVNYSWRFYSSLKKERKILNALDPTMARVHQLPLCLSNEGTEPACSLSSSHFVQAHTETSICILCLQVINAQGSCNI